MSNPLLLYLIEFIAPAFLHASSLSYAIVNFAKRRHVLLSEEMEKRNKIKVVITAILVLMIGKEKMLCRSTAHRKEYKGQQGYSSLVWPERRV